MPLSRSAPVGNSQLSWPTKSPWRPFCIIIAVIGEAANPVPDELRVCHPEIPWSRIVSQHDRVVHDCFGLDWTLLWKTIVDDLPRLRNQVSDILAVEFPDE